jgi:pyridoxine 5'-phosphate synthase PdxJ
MRGTLVPPDRYLATTSEYLDKCGRDAKVGVIVERMRADGLAVGFWLNPCVNFLTGSNYSISARLPDGFPIEITEVDGERTVVRP